MNPPDHPPNGARRLRRSRLLRVLLMAGGMLSTGLAVLGIVLPLLPTVPLLLLAAACFARSSHRFHRWLLDHPRLGPMVNDFMGGSGIPLRAKISAIVLLWAGITLSALVFVPLLPVQILLFAVAAGVTVYLVRLPLRD